MIALLAVVAYADSPLVGLPFGPARAIRHAPLASCINPGIEGIRWACKDEVAGLPMVTYFMVTRGRWTGLMTVGDVSVFEVPYVVSALESAWGPGTQSDTGGLIWREGDYIGSFTADKPTGEADPWTTDDRQVSVQIVIASAAEVARANP